MIVDSPTGRMSIESPDQLVELLSNANAGETATFYMRHLAEFPWLSVHLNDEFGYVHYFPADQHPGYQALGMAPAGCPSEISFHHAPGEEDPISMPRSNILGRDDATVAATEFLASLDLPKSVEWLEL